MGDDRSATVLYVDSDSRFRELVETSLEREWETFDVVTAADTGGALSSLESTDIDCVVSAHGGPERDALELLEALRDEHPDLPVVLFADDGVEEILPAALSAGLTDYIERGDDQFGVLADRIEHAVEQHVRESEQRALHQRYETVLETMSAAVFLKDTEGRYLLMNETCRNLFDLPESDVVGLTDEDLFPSELVEQYRTDDRRVFESGETVAVETQVRTDRETKTYLTRKSPVYDDGTVEAICGVLTDITEQKQYRSTLEALHEGATAIQQAETVEEACERTVDVSANILSFDQCTVVIREGEWLVPYARSEKTPSGGTRRMHVTEGLAGKTFQTGESYTVEDVTRDDTSKPAKDTYRSGLSVPLGEYGVFQAVSTEVSDFDAEDLTLAELLGDHTTNTIGRIEREQRLAREKQRLDEFASFVSHDLRNPLNVAMLRLNLLEDECDSEHLDDIDAALGRMEQLIEDLLTLARQGEAVGETEAVELGDLATNCWKNVETNCAHLDIAVEGTVRADESRLTTVLENLFVNAVRHGGDDVTITIGSLDDGHGFYVADDGDGIDEADRDKMFESGYSTHEDGTGIGLAIVEQIVRAHGWTIDVAESEDGGARFEISGLTIE